MPTNNFKLFDENKANMMGDEEYSGNSQRLNGVQTGVASSMLQNKTLYQVSLISYAIAQLMNQNGYDASDANAVSTFVSNMGSTFLQKVIDKASTTDVNNGTSTSKYIAPKQLLEGVPTMFGRLRFMLYNTSGTFVAPNNIAGNKVKFILIGGGGGGGGAVSTDSNSRISSPGGGGGSGYVFRGEATVVPGNSYSIVIGAGGAIGDVTDIRQGGATEDPVTAASGSVGGTSTAFGKFAPGGQPGGGGTLGGVNDTDNTQCPGGAGGDGAAGGAGGVWESTVYVSGSSGSYRQPFSGKGGNGSLFGGGAGGQSIAAQKYAAGEAINYDTDMNVLGTVTPGTGGAYGAPGRFWTTQHASLTNLVQLDEYFSMLLFLNGQCQHAGGKYCGSNYYDWNFSRQENARSSGGMGWNSFAINNKNAGGGGLLSNSALYSCFSDGSMNKTWTYAIGGGGGAFLGTPFVYSLIDAGGNNHSYPTVLAAGGGGVGMPGSPLRGYGAGGCGHSGVTYDRNSFKTLPAEYTDKDLFAQDGACLIWWYDSSPM